MAKTSQRNTSRSQAPVKREALTRDRVLRTAFRLADKEGLETLSMRTLAESLGVAAMSLYKHVSSREDLLEGLIELVSVEMDVPNSKTPWRKALSQRAHTMRKVFLQHTWAVTLFESTATTGPARMRHYESMIGILRRQGFSVELAYNTMILLNSYVYGFVIQEQAWGFDRKERPKVVAKTAPMISPAEFPHVVEMIGFVTAKNGYYADFDFGLDLLIEGLANAIGRENGATRT